MNTCIFQIIFLSLILRLSFAQKINIDFVKVPKGRYAIGSKKKINNPSKIFNTEGFSISKYEITNAQFKSFVDATNYITTAEKKLNAHVYRPGLSEYYWHRDTSANWKYPQGVSYYFTDTMPNHPVTCINYDDALAFCNWAKVRLPSFEEWEVACRAESKHTYFWGKEIDLVSNYANIWHAKTHFQEDWSDGYAFTSPVGCFRPNSWGIYDMAGNVFELCDGELSRDKKIMAHARGGSWWCSKSTCSFFNCLDIGSYRKEASFSNIGFRVVK